MRTTETSLISPPLREATTLAELAGQFRVARVTGEPEYDSRFEDALQAGDQAADEVGKHLRLTIPSDRLIIEVTEENRHNPEKTQAALYSFAMDQDRYMGYTVIQREALNPQAPDVSQPARMPDETPESPVKKRREIRQFEPLEPADLGMACADYAETALYYGYLNWQPGTLRRVPGLLTQAHNNLAIAAPTKNMSAEQIDIAIVQNARRALEAAALMTQARIDGFNEWARISELPKDMLNKIWKDYAPQRDAWKAFLERECTIGHNGGLLRAEKATIGVLLKWGCTYADTSNDVPPEYADFAATSDELEALFERRHKASVRFEKAKEAGRVDTHVLATIGSVTTAAAKVIPITGPVTEEAA